MFVNIKFKKSFSLIELSIVLIIMAMLAGATITGGKIINSAKAQKIIHQVNEYRSAIISFHETYNALPGDFDEGQYTFAPSDYVNLPTQEIMSLQDNIKHKIPINGNQDGIVSADIISLSSAYYSEAFGVWSMLSASGFIKEKYSNFCKKPNSQTWKDCVAVNFNIPKIEQGTKDAGLVFYKPEIDPSKNGTDYDLMGVLTKNEQSQNNLKDHHILAIMGMSNNQVYKTSSNLSGVRGGNGAIEASIMKIVDDKIDDGKPYTGLVYGINGYGQFGQCTTGASNIELQDIYTGGTSVEKIVYRNSSNDNCIGIFVVNEF